MKNKQELIQAIELKLQEIAKCKDLTGKLFLERDLSYLYADLGALTYADSIAREHNKKIPS